MLFDPQKIRPPHISLAFLILAIILQWVVKPVKLIPAPFNWLGLIVLADGIFIMVRAHGLFTKKGTPVSHAETPQSVVTEGMYRFSRNPMYVGGTLMFLGLAFTVGTWPFFINWLLIGAVLNFFVIPWEERRMEKLFGQEYLDYKTRTRRWI